MQGHVTVLAAGKLSVLKHQLMHWSILLSLSGFVEKNF